MLFLFFFLLQLLSGVYSQRFYPQYDSERLVQRHNTLETYTLPSEDSRLSKRNNYCTICGRIVSSGVNLCNTCDNLAKYASAYLAEVRDHPSGAHGRNPGDSLGSKSDELFTNKNVAWVAGTRHLDALAKIQTAPLQHAQTYGLAPATPETAGVGTSHKDLSVTSRHSAAARKPKSPADIISRKSDGTIQDDKGGHYCGRCWPATTEPLQPGQEACRSCSKKLKGAIYPCKSCLSEEPNMVISPGTTCSTCKRGSRYS